MIIFSGGTGTPKLLDGLKEILPEEELTVVVNTAEDLWVSGNLISQTLIQCSIFSQTRLTGRGGGA